MGKQYRRITEGDSKMKGYLSDSNSFVGNILIIGGTTEGRIAVQVCDEAEKNYFYSTKNSSQDVVCAHGKRISGELNRQNMPLFCQQNNIQLIVDAAHPFAELVHANVGCTAQDLSIPVIRVERHFPSRNNHLHWFDDYPSAIRFLEEKKITNLLALTGVNSISKLREYWSRNTCTFRIMKREESLAVVEKSGLPSNQIVFYEEERDDASLFGRLAPQAIITKESGESGGFSEKTEIATAQNIPVLVIRRPPLPYTPTATVFGKYGLRKQIEALLPGFFQLKTGYTTGSCATAAVKAALVAKLTGIEQYNVTISLPNDEPITIEISRTSFEPDGSVTCTVVKDSGDDPDVTNGIDICANVAFNTQHNEIRFMQGVGVGRVTLPGLGLEIGGPAINATPRKMMIREVYESIQRESNNNNVGVDITISVPQGEELAKRTFNPKLGIEGGISIIGTSGIVKPFSSEAFISSIHREIKVAKALNIEQLVINSGARSEKCLKAAYPDLPPQAFIQYGNFIGETINLANEEGFKNVVLGIMIGKAVKLAEGILDTHSKKSVMNHTFIQNIARESNCSRQTIEKIANITLARELWNIIPAEEQYFFQILQNRCEEVCKPLLPKGKITILLMDENGDFL